MHELSIVMNIIDIVDREVAQAGGGKVEDVELDIGRLSTVQMEAFDFAWQQGVRNTILQDAGLTVNHIDGGAHCNDCDANFRVDEVFDPCPACNGHFIRITAGKELRVRSLTII